jgi:hypothetical protein
LSAPTRCVSSIITTASAPGGIMPPVWTSAASPTTDRKRRGLTHGHFADTRKQRGQTRRRAVGVGRSDRVAIDGGALQTPANLGRGERRGQNAPKRVGGGNRRGAHLRLEVFERARQAAGGV